MPSSGPVGHSESVEGELVSPIRDSAEGARVVRPPRRRSPLVVLVVLAVAIVVVAAVLFLGVPKPSSTGPRGSSKVLTFR